MARVQGPDGVHGTAGPTYTQGRIVELDQSRAALSGLAAVTAPSNNLCMYTIESSPSDSGQLFHRKIVTPAASPAHAAEYATGKQRRPIHRPTPRSVRQHTSNIRDAHRERNPWGAPCKTRGAPLSESVREPIRVVQDTAYHQGLVGAGRAGVPFSTRCAFQVSLKASHELPRSSVSLAALNVPARCRAVSAGGCKQHRRVR